MKKFSIITLLFFISIFNSTISKALNSNITLSEELTILKGIYGCWSIPLGLPENLSVRIKLELRPDGSVSKTEVLDQEKMNKPEQRLNKVLAESILRAIKLCQPLRVPSTDYERWKVLTLNANGKFDLYLSVEPNKLKEYEKKIKEEEENKRLLEEKKIAEDKKKEEEEKTAKTLKKFEEKKKKSEAETQKNLNFINNFNKKNNLIKLNCFDVNNNTHFRIFIDDKLKKAVEIFPSGEVTILHTVRSNNDYFRLDLHSVKISSGFYSKEEIIINNFLSQKQRNISLAPTLNAYIAKFADEEIRFWFINRHTGISQIEPIGTVINDKLIVMDDTNQPTNNYFNLDYKRGKKFNCSKKSF
tara:strand:+ start:98 stop:1171 length:1074 start_codon:yes stop_codon:yes gene_type:complete